MSATPDSLPTDHETPTRIVVVGGGIAGLYCAYLLVEHHRFDVTVLELKPTLGGRIETLDLPGCRDVATGRIPTFKAECGPMRFELQLQDRFKALCDTLNINPTTFTPPRSADVPVSITGMSANELGGDGRPLSPLQLLALGVFAIVGKPTETRWIPDQNAPNEGQWEVRPTATSQAWLAALRDDDPMGFDAIRKGTRLREEPDAPFLWQIGFANALRSVLSNPAYDLIKNYGSFFHLVAENPNAAEWTVFWLRLFQLGALPLSTIQPGVRTVTERLERFLRDAASNRLHLYPQRRVSALSPNASSGGLVVHVIDESAATHETTSFQADHVILALPQQPLRELSANFPMSVQEDIEAVNGFPLLKAFLCLRRPPWWYPQKPLPQWRASDIPTRELHYFVSDRFEAGDELGDSAMVMLYTDQPDFAYWQGEVVDPARHTSAEIDASPRLKAELVRLLLSEDQHWLNDQIMKPDNPREPLRDPMDPVIQILRAAFSSMPELLVTLVKALGGTAGQLLQEMLTDGNVFEITSYAIRDWTRAPFGAGCHVWKPGVKSWEVRERLRAFGLTGHEPDQNVHVCGEAFSDYQGFIEGSLRSAQDVVNYLLEH